MNGRFPHDVFAIILLPFIALGTSVFLTPLLITAHVHHRLAVAVALGLAFVVLSAVLVRIWRRRREHR
jgi:membrane protein implicated in regulation of membrane protease activity